MSKLKPFIKFTSNLGARRILFQIIYWGLENFIAPNYFRQFGNFIISILKILLLQTW